MRKDKKIDSYQGDLMLPGGRCGVLLVHSLGGNPIELRFVAQSLARLGYTVHSPMLQGLAGGTDVLGLSRWTDWYDAVEKAYERLKAECDVVLVGGMSAGAVLALRLAAEKREGVHALMLFAPTLWPNGWSIPWYFNFFKLVRHSWCARLFHFKQREPHGIKDERIRKFLLDSFKTENRPLEDLLGRGGTTILQFRLMVKEVRKLFGEVRQPTLIFHPRFDDQSDLVNTMQLQRKLGGIVETCVLDDCYHMVTLDRQRSYVVDRTIDFAQRQTLRIAEAADVQRMRRNIKAAE